MLQLALEPQTPRGVQQWGLTLNWLDGRWLIVEHDRGEECQLELVELITKGTETEFVARASLGLVESMSPRVWSQDSTGFLGVSDDRLCLWSVPSR